MRDYQLLPRPAKDFLRRTVGRHVVAEKWWRLRYAAEFRAAERAEGVEVALATGKLTELPTAHVAVVIPTYRRPGPLRAAVESALAQTISDVAVVVVDDNGGEVGTLPADPRLTVVRLSRTRRSPGLSRNVGLRVSRSPYAAFLDDDNTWRPDHLERALAALADGAGLVYTGVRRVRGDGTELDVLSQPFDRRALADDNFVDANSVVVRRGSGVRFSPWPRPRWVHPKEDWELVYRLSARLRVTHVPDVTVDYLAHDGSFFSDWSRPPTDPGRKGRG
ncbi:hypothetical protein GCM10012275_22160 [Longimycelium tulufanense]|uniref:Glycosyltransferase 2-like domain-containing protein n=1 Tax=Longimycelium tulufanense TaxID=907463 RepID=A0A8J3FVD6_9PSEU|nr:glycosyltransferase [Longimycelium tulufanense]GGM50860.1 hypothetical protein GCM10012275_22160 [Longimycelium tulufanense]